MHLARLSAIVAAILIAASAIAQLPQGNCKLNDMACICTVLPNNPGCKGGKPVPKMQGTLYTYVIHAR